MYQKIKDKRVKISKNPKTMKIRFLFSAFLTVLALNYSVSFVSAQSRLVVQPGSTVTVKGTSNVHDWEMTSTSPSSSAEFKLLPNGKPETLQALNFRLKKNTLKSDKDGLDRRALEALEASKNPEISFVTATPAQVKQNGEKMLIETQGRLNIAGVTKLVNVVAECTNGSDNTLVCTGETKLKMTDFNITPPTMMLGALRTGNDVTISYTIIYK